MTLPAEIIARKRDGKTLSKDEITTFVRGLTDESFSDAQVAAMAMAIFLRGLDAPERVALTQAMQQSGTTLTWDLPGPVVDKHSTGGVGDNVSLILAPALAACGAFVPMISGRGLGHTGGTLDKFDSIPGYQTAPNIPKLQEVTAKVGCAIVGQTAEIAPADKRLYALRDVTGTVESIDLITPSILSKKLAAGLDALVLDVKVGSGAFMADTASAEALARVLTEVANDASCKTSTLITDMNEPLASAAGNALEMRNAIDLLRGTEIDTRLWDVGAALGGELLASAGLQPDTKAGEAAIRSAMETGQAAEKFAEMVTEMGGPSDLMERPEAFLDEAPVIEEVYAEAEGFIAGIDTRAVGLAVVELGGGRKTSTDPIDYRVGFDWLAGCGRLADRETPIARVHAATAEAASAAAGRLRAAYQIAETPEAEGPLVLKRI